MPSCPHRVAAVFGTRSRRRDIAGSDAIRLCVMWPSTPAETTVPQCYSVRHSGHHMQRIFQATAWLLARTIVVLSLGSPSVRPVTGAAHDLEHLLIFLATGTAFGLGYPRRGWLLTIALPTFAAAIETAQNWVPGRHAGMSDFLVDAATLCLGVGLSYASLKLRAAVIRR